jgi:hypothetical protein
MAEGLFSSFLLGSLLTWRQWVGDDLAYGPVSIPTPVLATTPVFTFAPTPVFASASSTAKKNPDGASSNDAAVISNSKIKIEEVNVSTLLREFRVPPAPNLVTPRSVDHFKVRAGILDDSVIVVDLCESSDEAETETETETKPRLFKTSTPSVNHPQTITEDVELLTLHKPEKNISISNEATSVFDKANKSIKATKLGSTVKSAHSSKAKKKLDDDSEPGDVMPKISPTLGSTRKRRPAVDYGRVPEDEIFDRSDANDDDFQCEEVNYDDERLDKGIENKWPDLETPSKRQKRARR